MSGSRGRGAGWRLVSLLLCFPLLMVGQRRHTNQVRDPEGEAPAQVERGRALFKVSCALCHGLDGKGSTGPDLVRSPLLSHDDHGSLIGPAIRSGRVDKGMPSYPTMRPDQVTDIAAFLHHQANVALHSNRLRSDYSLARLLTGNPREGKEFFHGVGGCTKCHSVTGDLAGIAHQYSPIDLQLMMVYPRSKNVSKTAIVTLKNGERFEGKLMNEDEFNVGVMCQDGWYRSWAKDNIQVETHDPLDAHRALMPKYTDADLHNLFAYLETLK